MAGKPSILFYLFNAFAIMPGHVGGPAGPQ